jgi:U4/U6 small nuclear ribonucleoprotein PRP3
LVIVEGGPKALKKYKKLMLHRIKWNPDTIGEEDDDSDADGVNKDANSCLIVWEGIRDNRHFYDWRFKQCPSETIAREHLKKHNAEHYWDMALSLSIVEQDGDNDV